MKKFNKILSLLMVYLFAVALIPSNLVSTITKAETGLPKYLETQEGYVRQKYQYKDISVITNTTFDKESVSDEILKIQNGKKEKIATSEWFVTVGAKEVLLEDDKIIDIETGQGVDNKNSMDLKAKEIVSKNINEKVESFNVYPMSDRNNNKFTTVWLSTALKEREGVITKNKNFVDLSQGENVIYMNANSVNKNGLFSMATSYNKNTEGEQLCFINITNDGQMKKYPVNNRNDKECSVKNLDGSSYIYENNGVVILKTNDYSKGKNITTYIDQYIIKNNELVFDKTVKKISQHKVQLSQDIKGDVWTVGDGYVSKIVGGNLVNVYEVDKDMSDIDVYDENHMILTYSKKEENKIVGKYTIINNSINKIEEKPNTGENEGAAEVKPDVNDNKKTEEVKTSANDPKEDTKHEVKPADDKGIQTVVVNKLNKKDDVNVLEVTLDTKTKEAVVEIDDIATIKDGKGSLAVKMGNTTINLPFEAIDKSLLVDGAKVLLKHKVEDNSDIVKDLKGIKKVYNFDLIVKAGEKETSIHNFKGGVAEIAINLSDEELTGLDKDKLAVFYYNETTKSFELMETKVEGNKVTFKTPHFSKYVIAEKEANNLPKTGSNVNTRNLMLAAGVLLIAGVFLVTRRKQQA